MNEAEIPVITSSFKSIKSIILNRPQHINSLNIEMIKMITDHFMEALTENKCLYILFQGRGNKGFCAGGDVKNIAQNVKDHDLKNAMLFFEREYALDLLIHKSSKPVIVVADGITMGGGLGIAAGADIVIVTERTVMAMPETRIGFFPDIGATGWLFQKCRRGYPEYLALTGYDMRGIECVRLGLATHFIESKNIAAVIDVLENYIVEKALDKKSLLEKLSEQISVFTVSEIHGNQKMDDWVATYFSGKNDLPEIMASLSHCSIQKKLCDQVFSSIAERSPSALVLTLKLLRLNEGRPLEEVFARDLKTAKYIVRRPDYLEGVRARLIDKDNKPLWNPDKIEQVDLSDLILT